MLQWCMMVMIQIQCLLGLPPVSFDMMKNREADPCPLAGFESVFGSISLADPQTLRCWCDCEGASLKLHC